MGKIQKSKLYQKIDLPEPIDLNYAATKSINDRLGKIESELRFLAQNIAKQFGIQLRKDGRVGGDKDFHVDLSGESEDFELTYFKALPSPVHIPFPKDVSEENKGIIDAENRRRDFSLEIRSDLGKGVDVNDKVETAWENGPYHEAIVLSKEGGPTLSFINKVGSDGNKNTVVEINTDSVQERDIIAKSLSNTEVLKSSLVLYQIHPKKESNLTFFIDELTEKKVKSIVDGVFPR